MELKNKDETRNLWLRLSDDFQTILKIASPVGAIILVVTSVYFWTRNEPIESLAAAAAAATFGLVFVGFVTTQQNREVIKTAIDEAVEIRKQADSSQKMAKEMQIQREFAYKPLLIITWDKAKGPGPMKNAIVIKNIGNGPAVAIKLYGQIRNNNAGISAKLISLAPGDHVLVDDHFLTNILPNSQPRQWDYKNLFWKDPTMAAEAFIVGYRDWFGKCYRVTTETVDQPEEFLVPLSDSNYSEWARLLLNEF
jgi:hypothetical protein